MAKTRLSAVALCFSLLIALFGSLYAAGMHSSTELVLGCFGVLFVGLAVGLHFGRCLDLIVKYRWLLALALLIALVLFEVSGSSIALWGPTLGEDALNGTLFGIPRTDRSDEWLVFTPFSFSQASTGYASISSVIRGGGTDVTMVYAQPAWAVATLFRPFLWGHLALGPAKGLSLFWCARACALVLVTFDTMSLLAGTDLEDARRTRLAAYGALLVSFAPLVEWWFAVNGTVELLVFGQGLVLSLHYLLRAGTAVRRWAWAALLTWLLGCYAMIIYPAWQVPFVYVFGAMGVWDFVMWLRDTSRQERPRFTAFLLPLVAAGAVVITGLLLAILHASDAIHAITSTVYPGRRSFAGGDLAPFLPNTTTTLLSALWPDLAQPNPCESAAFVALFPLGALASVVLFVRSLWVRRPDSCLGFLLVPYVLLLVFGLIGFPPAVAKFMLLNNILPARLPFALGYLDVALLVRAIAVAETFAQVGPSGRPQEDNTSAAHMALDQRTENDSSAASLSAGSVVWRTFTLLALVAAFVAVAHWHNPELMGLEACALLALAYLLLLAPLTLPALVFAKAAHGRSSFLVAGAFVVVVAGLCVNPIQQGIRVVTESSALDAIRDVVEDDPQALWITDTSTLGQACIMAGAPTITSVNCYPNLERWHAVDTDGRFEDAYNRYAHFNLELGSELSFQNPQPDVCNVVLPADDVPKLQATYWLSRQPLAEQGTEHVRFEPIATAGDLTVFRIVQQ